MIYAIMFDDNEDKAAMRGRFMKDHLAFPKSQADAIREAGPLIDAENGTTDQSESTRKTSSASSAPSTDLVDAHKSNVIRHSVPGEWSPEMSTLIEWFEGHRPE